MSTTLSPLVNLSAQVYHVLSDYFLPLGIAIALVLFVVLIVFGRGKNHEPALAISLPEPETPPQDTRTRILIVDDSAVARAKLGKLFDNAGYKVELAVDGVEAMHKMAQEFFAVLITDLEMPNMNGLELIAAVLGGIDTEDMPIIAITGHDELQARVHEYQGLYGIFKKPWNDRELLKRVEALATLRKPVAALAKATA